MAPIIPQDFSLPFMRKEQVAKDTYSFYFDRTKHPDFVFYPGQYNRVILRHKDPDNRGSSRNFSIASSPNNKDELMITTKVVQSTFKKAFFNMKPGTDVEFFGPVGRFVFDKTEKKPHVFFSQGLGVAPFHSMILYAAEENIVTPMTLFASFSSVEDFLYFDEFTTIAKEHPNIKHIYIVSRPTALWSGDAGNVSEVMVRRYVPDIADAISFACGPIAMVDLTTVMLENLGVAQENLRRENFVGY